VDAGSGRRVVGVGYEVKSQWLDWETGGGTRQQRVEKTRESVCRTEHVSRRFQAGLVEVMVKQ